MNNTLFKERMVFRYQWEFRQNITGLVNDQSNETCRKTDIKKIHRHMIRHQTSKNHLVEIHPVANQQSYRHKGYSSVVAFRTGPHIN